MIDSTTEEVFATIPGRRPRRHRSRGGSGEGGVPRLGRACRRPSAASSSGRVAEALEARRDEIAAVIAHEVGMPKHQALTAQVGGGISGFSAAAELADHLRVRGLRERARRAGARRRGRLHHAVELPAEPDRREGRVRTRRRLHRGPEAVGGRAGQRVHPRRDHRRDRLSGRRVQPRERSRSGRRRSARDAPRRRHGVVHRFDTRRSAGSPSSRHSR